MADHDRPWLRNTRVHVQSTSKAVTAATAMVLCDRGELDLDATVGRYWPEYATNGKEATTVRMLLSHAAGSTRLPGYTELLDLDGNGFDQYDEIARRLARLYTPLAMNGVLDGRQVVEPETVGEFTTPTPPGGPDLVIGLEQKWTPGSHHANNSFFPALPPIYGPSPDAFGMSGGGGNYGFADPAAGIAGGFVRNHYSNTMGLSALLVDALYKAM